MTQRLRSRKQGLYYRKERDKPEKDKQFTKRVLKTLRTHNTKIMQQANITASKILPN
jgi:hypothetical protein